MHVSVYDLDLPISRSYSLVNSNSISHSIVTRFQTQAALQRFVVSADGGAVVYSQHVIDKSVILEIKQ